MKLTELGNSMMQEILLCLDGVYIIDDRTKEIVFVNDFISRGKPENFVGKKCYNALLGKTEPCSFCPKHVHYYPQKQLECYEWEYYNNLDESWYKIKNRFTFENGKHYRIGNITQVQEIMDLAKEAIDEVSELQESITEFRRLKTALEAEARRDKMTRLYNRNQYISDLCRLYTKADSLGVLFFDINNLKVINDTLEHAAGDIIIKRLSFAISSAKCHPFKAYRIGGDEFVAVTMNCSQEALNELKDEVLANLDRANHGQPFLCEVAVGSSYAHAPCDPEVIVLKADKLMYEDKCKIKGVNP